MLAIINQYISYTPIDHSEHGAERCQASKVHNMFEVFGSVPGVDLEIWKSSTLEKKTSRRVTKFSKIKKVT